MQVLGVAAANMRVGDLFDCRGRKYSATESRRATWQSALPRSGTERQWTRVQLKHPLLKQFATLTLLESQEVYSPSPRRQYTARGRCTVLGRHGRCVSAALRQMLYRAHSATVARDGLRSRPLFRSSTRSTSEALEKHPAGSMTPRRSRAGQAAARPAPPSAGIASPHRPARCDACLLGHACHRFAPRTPESASGVPSSSRTTEWNRSPRRACCALYQRIAESS